MKVTRGEGNKRWWKVVVKVAIAAGGGVLYREDSSGPLSDSGEKGEPEGKRRQGGHGIEAHGSGSVTEAPRERVRRSMAVEVWSWGTRTKSFSKVER